MTEDRRVIDFRKWALMVLDLLGATADRQVAWLRKSNVGSDELLLQFDDVLYVAGARLADGSLTQEQLLLLRKVDESANVVNAGPSSIWDESALKIAPEWENLRVVALAVKENLEEAWDSDLDY